MEDISPQIDLAAVKTATIKVNTTFDTWEDAKVAIQIHSHLQGGNVKSIISNRKRHEYHCDTYNRKTKEGCPYRIWFVHIPNSTMVKCTRIIAQHECTHHVVLNSRQGGNRLCYLVPYIKAYFPKLNHNTKASDIQDTLLIKGVQVHRLQQIRIAKNQILGLATDDQNRSWRQMPDYLRRLEEQDPGSYIRWLRNESNSIVNTFIAPSSRRQAVQHLRPVFAVDGTFSKTRSKYVILIAATYDANRRLIILAWGTCQSETGEGCGWFFKHLKQAFPGYVTPDTLLVTDRGVGLIKGALAELPDMHHVHCIYHIRKNRSGGRKGDAALFASLAVEYDKQKFKAKWEAISLANPALADVLWKDGLHNWARCHSPRPRYGMLTSNPCEQANGVIRSHRRLAVVNVLHAIWEHQAAKIPIHRAEARRETGLLPKRTRPAYDEAAKLGSRYRVVLQSETDTAGSLDYFKACVQHLGNAHAKTHEVVLNLRSRTATCSCGQPQDAHFICRHVVAVCNLDAVPAIAMK